MISEFAKSIHSILYERVTSPLFGALVVSWGFWNWKIIYLTLFISEKRIEITKIEYIVNNFNDINHVIYYPILSTIFLLTIMPIFSNGAYWLHIIFHKWKTDKKHKVEMSQLLTIEKSIQLRTELAEKEKEFDTLLSGKNTEIEQLKLQIESINNAKKPSADKPSSASTSNVHYSEELINDIAETILRNYQLDDALEALTERIQNGYPISETVDSQSLAYFSSNELINHLGEGIYEFTPLGKKVHKVILSNKYKT